MKSLLQIIKGQSAVEYLLLLGVVTALMVVAFKGFLPRVNQSSELYYNEATRAMLGNAPLNGTLDAFRINYP